MSNYEPKEDTGSPNSAPLLARTTFPHTACSLEFCPHLPRVFAVGTYQLADAADGRSSNQTREGECIVYDGGKENFHFLARTATPGTLDIKWSHTPTSNEASTLSLVDALGRLTTHVYSHTSRKLTLTSTHPLSKTPGVLALSLDYSDRISRTSPQPIASLSSGEVCLVDPEREGPVETWQAHDFEAWIAAWDQWSSGKVVFTGGDDCKLKGWDLRVGTTSPTFTNKRFDGGVTTIQSSPHDEHILAVGSYDSHLYLFDTRSPARPLSTTATAGGIWRAKFHPSPSRAHDVLLATMHGGFEVVRLSDDWSGGEVVKTCQAHESLAYGVDWDFAGWEGSIANGETLVGSASFYDKMGGLWKA